MKVFGSGGLCCWGPLLLREFGSEGLCCCGLVATENICVLGLLLQGAFCIWGRLLRRGFFHIGVVEHCSVWEFMGSMVLLRVWAKQDRFRGRLGDEVAVVATKRYPGQLVWQWWEESKTMFVGCGLEGFILRFPPVWRILVSRNFCFEGWFFSWDCACEGSCPRTVSTKIAKKVRTTSVRCHWRLSHCFRNPCRMRLVGTVYFRYKAASLHLSLTRTEKLLLSSRLE